MRAATFALVVLSLGAVPAGAGDAELNAVRTRAGLPPISGATMEDLIHERRVEQEY